MLKRGGRRHDGGDEIVTHGVPEIDVGEDPEARARETDRWIARRLREIDYDLIHPEAQLLADHLQSLGAGTLINLKRSNELLNACEKLIMCKLPAPPESWHDEAQGLIIVAVRAATPGFITRSMRKWDLRGAAAISTYFVNYCLFALKKIYLQYCKEEFQRRVECPVGDAIDMFETTVSEVGSEDLVVARQTIREVTKLMGSQEFARIVLLTMKSWTRKQIAEELGISVSSLDRRIAECRKNLSMAAGRSPSDGMAASVVDNLTLGRIGPTGHLMSNTENFARMLERSSIGSGQSRQARLKGSIALAEHSPDGTPWINRTAFVPDIATLHLTIANMFGVQHRPGPSELWLRAALNRTNDGPVATRLAALLEQRHLAKEAVVWYQRVAELGDLTATTRLAVFCELKNCREIAEILLSLARSRMTPERLIQADELVATLPNAARHNRTDLISDCADEDLLFWVGSMLLVSDRRDIAGECYSAVARPGHGHLVARLSLADLRPSAVPEAGELRSTGGSDLADLVSAAVNGTRAGIASLLSRIRPLVLRYCRARVGSWGTTSVSAEDVAQETCLAVLTALPSYRDQGKSFLAFVYGIAAHKVADAHRAAGRNRAEPVAEVPDSMADPADDPEQRAMQAELAARMNTLLEALPDKQREILILRVVVGLSAEETAEVVESTPGAVRVAQHRALAKLRGVLSSHEVL